MTLSATLPLRLDAERVRLRLGTAFIEHVDDLWPEGGAPGAQWIRDHTACSSAARMSSLRHDGRDVQRWPQPTEGLSGVRVRLSLAPPARLDRRLLEPQTLHLDLIDYPGEWLLDLPLLSLGYAEWSAGMEELANAGKRAALSAPWLAQAEALDPAAREDPFALARIGSAYVDYLKRCRAEGLSALRPLYPERRHAAGSSIGLHRAQNGHSITSSGTASNDAGMFWPSALATLRLITSFNCSTGRSAGLAPFRILST
jgi:hypothetical protein